MKAFDSMKGKIGTDNRVDTIAPSPIRPVPITPRLMRAVPSNIARVIGNFEDEEVSYSMASSEKN